MYNTTRFYHYLPSGEFACDEEPEYQPKQDGAVIKSLYQMEGIPDYEPSPEDEDDGYFNIAVAMEEIDLKATPLPNMIWTPNEVPDFGARAIFDFVKITSNENINEQKSPSRNHHRGPRGAHKKPSQELRNLAIQYCDTMGDKTISQAARELGVSRATLST
ncbi:hypothetical protein BD408DRAFT_439825 [Parasitella parasitica]|nr:hypothetical protein BD408DRAFT_439825 [Parasitella parasitica]